MRKTVLVVLCSLVQAVQVLAQADVSAYYLKNNNFDEELNYGAQLTGNVRGDVINEVYGWTNETTATYTVAGTFAYNPNVTFNGSSALPAAGYQSSEGGALGLTTGWGMVLQYSQKVTLPKGKYRLCAAYYNVGTATAGNSLLGWIPSSGTETVSGVKSFPVGKWTVDTIDFVLTAQRTGMIRIGFAANEGSGSGAHAKVLVDYVRLLCSEVDKTGLKSAITSANSAYGDGSGVYAAELKAVIDEAQATYDDEEASVTAIIELTARLKEATETYRYKNASESKPLALTSCITNQGFENGVTGWDNVGFQTQGNSAFPGKTGGTYIERWVSIGKQIPDVEISQPLAGLRNGKYLLRAAVGHIQQNGAGSTVNKGDPQTGATLFAGFYNVPVDTMKSAKDLYFTVVDGRVDIGVRAHDATGNWICADNFRLYYVGELTDRDYVAYLTQYIGYIRTSHLNKHIQATVRQSAENTISAVEALCATEPLDADALRGAKTDLDGMLEEIEASADRYTTLENTIAYAEQVKEWYKEDEAKRTKMETAIQAAQAVWADEGQTDAQIQAAVTALETVRRSVDKKVYTAEWSMGNVNDSNNNYYIGRSRQSKNWILFWEKGYGEHPTAFVCGNYTIDVDEVLRRAEVAFAFYTDSLKFIKKGTSKTDTYKMVIRLRYDATAWEATGSGVDNLIGLLTLTPWAAPSRNWQTLYHEIGHCFQYQVHCDNNNQNGWMYAPGGGYGCAFWEQCAQWQAYKIMPADQFTNEWFDGYMKNVHKHILHESPRYNNYFVHDFWCYKHGVDFVGRLWNESKNPEDAVEAYKRITGITNSEFNDEMYECAARFATWDIPALRQYGEARIDSRPQPDMNKVDDNYWRISAAVAPENTGHNIIKLNVPSAATTVSASFEGLNRQDGFRVKNPTYAEWRYGFVAYLKDGNRVYGDMGKSTYAAPKDTIRFNCPANCKRLFFVVSGGPKTYWRQIWDDNDDNDEQWPYQVKFGNTNRYGSANLPDITGSAMTQADEEWPAVTVDGRTLYVAQPTGAMSVRILSASGCCVGAFPASLSAVSTVLPSGFYMVQLMTSDGKAQMVRKVCVK